MYVAGNSVYVVGYESDGRYNIAKLWKNGNVIFNTDGTQHAAARSMYVSGTDIYVGGREGYVAKVWKNGNVIFNMDGISYAEVRAVFVVE